MQQVIAHMLQNSVFHICNALPQLAGCNSATSTGSQHVFRTHPYGSQHIYLGCSELTVQNLTVLDSILVLQAGIQHVVFSGLFDTRPYFHQLPLTPSGQRLPHYETKAEIKVCCSDFGLLTHICRSCSCNLSFLLHVSLQLYVHTCTGGCSLSAQSVAAAPAAAVYVHQKQTVVTSVNRKEKKRKDYTFRRQFNEKPSIIPGCPRLQ